MGTTMARSESADPKKARRQKMSSPTGDIPDLEVDDRDYYTKAEAKELRDGVYQDAINQGLTKKQARFLATILTRSIWETARDE